MGCIQKTAKPLQKPDNNYQQQMPILKLWSIEDSSNKTKQLSTSSQQNMYELAFQNEILYILNRVEPQKHVLNGRSIRKRSTTISPVQGILKNANSSPQSTSNKKKYRVNFSISCNFSIGRNLRFQSKSLPKEKHL